MEESGSGEEVRDRATPKADAPGTASRKAGDAVQTPPPDTKSNPPPAYDSDAATIMDGTPLFDSPTITELPHPSEAPTIMHSPSAAGPGRQVSSPRFSSPGALGATAFLLPVGSVLGSRYEILQMLGEGGMGAVYKARDNELEREIALKVIRPELASNPEILQRFKQELILARQVTDRNIIRIFDLGEADGIRFITMEYVEGTSLQQMLRERGKIPVQESVEIILQTLKGLRAAHREGVIHRDLKPGNIMRDKQGRILVMDFGLARSIESDGMTKTGAVLGTMEYMSPEQAMGSELDPRSDLFTVGLILFELLTGKMPFKAETAIASLLKRVQERAVSVSSMDNAIPMPIADIVAKCLERDPNARYQTAEEMIDDLERWHGGGAAATLHFPPVHTWGRDIPWHWIGGIGAVLVIAIATFLLRGKLFTGTSGGGPEKSASGSPVSVLVADFQNNTSDPIFDGTLEPMFNVALEGASFINAFNRGTARQLAEKLPNPTNKINEQAARLIAVSEGINVILTGSLSSRGTGYELSVKAIDPVTGKLLASDDVAAENKDQLLLDVAKIAVPIRKALGDTTSESVQLAATQGSFAASNLQAVHEYSIAMEQQAAGKTADALQSFSRAAELDPNFARAYAGIAAAAGNLGQLQNAEKYAKLAMEHVDRMTERERYRVRGQYYIRTEAWQKCIEEYSDLVKKFPADDVGQNNLALCYARMLNMPKAMEEAQRALDLTPKDVMVRLNYSLYACYATDFASCEREAGKVYQLNPNYEEAFLALAYAQTGENQLAQATETYQKLEKVSPRGASLAVSGLANIAMYQGKLREAVQMLGTGAVSDLAAKEPDAAADKFTMLAYAELLRGDKKAAAVAAGKALANSQSVKTRFLAARTFVEAGEVAKARKLAAGLGAEIHAEPQAYAKLILGEAALSEHEPKAAVQLFSDANNLYDAWIGRFDLGRAYLEAGAFTEADSEFDRCIQRRGEAVELFMDDMPTYSYLPMVYYYQGKVREGLKSPGFADSYRQYLAIRGSSTEDPLVPELRRRIGQ